MVQIGLDVQSLYPLELVEAANYLAEISASGLKIDDLKQEHLGVLRGILGPNIFDVSRKDDGGDYDLNIF